MDYIFKTDKLNKDLFFFYVLNNSKFHPKNSTFHFSKIHTEFSHVCEAGLISEQEKGKQKAK